VIFEERNHFAAGHGHAAGAQDVVMLAAAGVFRSVHFRHRKIRDTRKTCPQSFDTFRGRSIRNDHFHRRRIGLL
jgi:hypothetical protein